MLANGQAYRRPGRPWCRRPAGTKLVIRTLSSTPLDASQQPQALPGQGEVLGVGASMRPWGPRLPPLHFTDSGEREIAQVRHGAVRRLAGAADHASLERNGRGFRLSCRRSTYAGGRGRFGRHPDAGSATRSCAAAGSLGGCAAAHRQHAPRRSPSALRATYGIRLRRVARLQPAETLSAWR